MVMGMVMAADQNVMARWPVAEAAPAAEEAGAKAASAAVSRKEQILQSLTASGQTLPPEALAALEAMSEEDLGGADSDGSDESEYEEFWATIDVVCGTATPVGQTMMIYFCSSTPEAPGAKADGEDADAEDDDYHMDIF